MQPLRTKKSRYFFGQKKLHNLFGQKNQAIFLDKKLCHLLGQKNYTTSLDKKNHANGSELLQMVQRTRD